MVCLVQGRLLNKCLWLSSLRTQTYLRLEFPRAFAGYWLSRQFNMVHESILHYVYIDMYIVTKLVKFKILIHNNLNCTVTYLLMILQLSCLNIFLPCLSTQAWNHFDCYDTCRDRKRVQLVCKTIKMMTLP